MKKLFSSILICLPLILGSPLDAKFASQDDDYDFNQERMIVDHGEIFLISTFESSDGVTVYNFNGQRLWEVRFHAKIVSWNVQSDIILVFSKDRNGSSTYLTCLSRTTGRVLWEKP